MDQHHLIPHLFRTEHSKLIAVLCKSFSLSHIELAEDIVSETFLIASETWGMKGIPENPTAWLYVVAKNSAKQHLKRQGLFQEKIRPLIEVDTPTATSDPFLDFSEENIEDSQLKMIFAVCNPDLSNEAQIGLALRILCGFGVDEIAKAFVTNKETVNKRLHRAKSKLKESINMSLPQNAELHKRLDNVLKILYLLFNEGYYSNSNDKTLRQDLCLEAMRLALLLTQNAITETPSTHALIALMCFHASRFDARIDENNHWILYQDQDESLWDQELIDQGEHHMNLAARGDSVTIYHLEAAIAYWHTQKNAPDKWANILTLYNQLLIINYSPTVAINRTFAYAQVEGTEKGLKEALKLKLDHMHSYHALLGELYTRLKQQSKAKKHLEKALLITKNIEEKNTLKRKIENLTNIDDRQ